MPHKPTAAAAAAAAGAKSTVTLWTDSVPIQCDIYPRYCCCCVRVCLSCPCPSHANQTSTAAVADRAVACKLVRVLLRFSLAVSFLSAKHHPVAEQKYNSIGAASVTPTYLQQTMACLTATSTTKQHASSTAYVWQPCD